MKKSRYLPLGSISTGTLQPMPIIHALVDALRYVRMTRAHRAIVSGAFKRALTLTPYSQDILLTNLIDIAQAYCPPFTYIGSHPGDSADIGVWFDNDMFQVDCDEKFTVDLDTMPRGYSGLAFQISDHGNITVYSVTRGRVREIYSIV